MYLEKLKVPLFIVMASLALCLTSCEKYDEFDDDDKTENFIGSFFDDQNDDDFDEDDDFEDLCFDFVFPVSISFPGGDVVAYDSLDVLWDEVAEWYDTAPEADSLDPMIVFPVDVVLANGETYTAMDDDKLSYLQDECEDDHGHDDDDGHGHDDCDDYADWISDDLEECYDIVYPLVVTIGEDSISINSEMEVDSVFEVIEEIIGDSENFDIGLVYPVTIIDLASNTNITIDSVEQLIQLAIACEISSLCFSINYPITLVATDGTSQEIANDAELITTYVQFEIDEREGDLIPVFPVTVTLDTGEVLTKENLEAFEALYAYCD